jgi:ubiquinone/menaquinone biosynthesis C-methylase UbiE
VIAWLLPGAGLWLLGGAWGYPFGLATAEEAYATSTLASGLALAPGGVLVAGRQMLAILSAHGIPETLGALTVLAARLATAGLSIALGIVFVLIHVRTAAARTDSHFDDIADAYDVQIPEARRHALLDRKTSLMREAIVTRKIGRRGLDVGCGQGAYVARMRSLGFDVSGIDASPGQVGLAARNVGEPEILSVGSVLDIPAPDQSFDFLYIINVLHHLGSIEEQRRAFEELFRVLKPGGLLFVHEINTRNVLFRFYMGYVFPSLNCIDEGVERWLLPHRMAQYTNARVVDVRYFTFLPDFLPRPLVSLLTPIERLLEGSPWRAYSAHYMAVLEKEPRRDP